MSKINPMLDLFFIEAQGQISVLKESLSVLANELDNKKELDSLLRASGSLKAAAKLASLEIVFEVAQTQENIFTSVSQGKLTFTTKHISIIQESIDTLLQLVDEGADNINDWLESNHSQLTKQKWKTC